MKKILPITVSPINGYPDYAYPLSVILNEKQSLEWFFSNFIQIYYMKNENGSPVNFYYSDLNNRLWDTRFPLLDYQTLHKDVIQKLNIDIIDFIKCLIDLENYCYIYLNEFYLPSSSAYKNKQYPHVQFIYGYDESESVFYMSGYDKSQRYNCYSIKFSDVRNAYLFCDRDYYDDKNNIYIFKYNRTGSPYNLDMNAIYTQTMDFLKSKDSSIKYNNCFNSRPNMLYGLDVITQIIDDINRHKQEYIEFKNPKPLYILREHKTLMILRIQYMIEKGYIKNDEGCVLLFSKLEKEYRILLNMFLKFDIVGDIDIIDNMVVKLKENYLLEEQAFEKFIALVKKEA